MYLQLVPPASSLNGDLRMDYPTRVSPGKGRSLIGRIVLLSMMLIVSCPVGLTKTQESPFRYSGIEFFGSPRITRAEIEKSLGLKPNASFALIDKAVAKLYTALSVRHIDANVEVVTVVPDKAIVVIDIPDSATDPPWRLLKNPHHVDVRSEKPFLLLAAIDGRKMKLAQEGKSCEETYRNGLKYFSDEYCARLADQLSVLVPIQKSELLAVTESDPDPKRRQAAVELMNWAGDVPYVASRLVSALDDADADVRSTTARYFFNRLKILPDDFPFDDLIDALSRQLNRPHHQDRVKALYCLFSLATIHPDLDEHIKNVDGAKLQQLDQDSVIPIIHNSAEQLLSELSKKHVPFAPVTP